MKITLDSPVQYVPRIGPAKAKLLENLQINTVKDLLWHIPFRYDDFSIISPINRVQIGDTVTIKGEVVSIKNSFTKTGKKLQLAKISDATGTIDVLWFNQMYLTSIIKAGMTIQLSGKKDWFGTKPVMVSPEYELGGNSLHTGRLVPVYNETEGISSKWLRGRIDFVLREIGVHIDELLPPAIKETYNVLPTFDALKNIHFPQQWETAKKAKYSLAFEELYMLILASSQKKRAWQQTKKAYQIEKNTIDSFIDFLPYTLTTDQMHVIKEILTDFEKPIPMNRLLEGDVGAGKTVVAAAGMFAAFQKGYSSILMAPTQILAQQHYKTLTSVLSPLSLPVDLILSGTNIQMQNGPRVFVGTHALLSNTRNFSNIAFIAIDEQQRFGVKQRELLRTKTEGKQSPHVLSMTATPIPRSIAQVLFGNIDLSQITSMPHGRKQIKTWVVPNEKRDSAYNWIKKQLTENNTQAFIVCPLVNESETMETVKAVKNEFIRLKNEIFPNFRLGLLHGQMKIDEKQKAMKTFEDYKSDILVCTPVVEVGIDIKNATIMLIEASDRFGLAQLHQLRGRVGRSDKQSYCLLFTENTLALPRLKAMETVFNGPQLAELDLSLRGPGDVLGTRQHGLPNLKIASFSNTALIKQAHQAVQSTITLDPDLTNFPHLRQIVEKSTIEATID